MSSHGACGCDQCQSGATGAKDRANGMRSENEELKKENSLLRAVVVAAEDLHVSFSQYDGYVICNDYGNEKLVEALAKWRGNGAGQ
jgi:hypothetical protein